MRTGQRVSSIKKKKKKEGSIEYLITSSEIG
jgi:hypothetical protein